MFEATAKTLGVNHIGTATAFVVLGIMIPVVLLVIIVVTARWLAAD